MNTKIKNCLKNKQKKCENKMK